MAFSQTFHPATSKPTSNRRSRSRSRSPERKKGPPTKKTFLISGASPHAITSHFFYFSQVLNTEYSCDKKNRKCRIKFTYLAASDEETPLALEQVHFFDFDEIREISPDASWRYKNELYNDGIKKYHKSFQYEYDDSGSEQETSLEDLYLLLDDLNREDLQKIQNYIKRKLPK